jgi:PTH1 family peptidyl-tRNA hydrolase
VNSPIKLIAGLGNPGPAYSGTRHNAGAEFVTALADSLHGTLKLESKFFGATSRVTLGGRDLRLLIPTTFMNLSGRAVAALASYYQIEPSEILIAHDELDLPPGTARLKRGGGHGGHNGLRDSIQKLGNNRDFARLRIGIGHPGDAKMVTDFVLKKAPKDESDKIQDSIDRALQWLPHAIAGDWEKAMTGLHSEPQTDDQESLDRGNKNHPKGP